jgi:hypothetical protein
MKTRATEDPDTNPCSYIHLVFDKGAKKATYRKESFFNKFFLGKLNPCCRKLKLDQCLSPIQYELKVDSGF